MCDSIRGTADLAGRGQKQNRVTIDKQSSTVTSLVTFSC